jgi:hypothetical protein
MRKRLADYFKDPTEGNGHVPVPAITPNQGSAKRTKPEGEARLGVLLSTVQPESVRWLWPGRIPLGKLTIVDGDPGLGKSVLSLDLAARVSRGLTMPFDEPGASGDPAGVVILSAEDGLSDTIVPRLREAGADLTRILALETVGPNQRFPTLPIDAVYLHDAAKQISAGLVVIDPLMAYLGPDINAHKDGDCRRALQPLADLARETGAAVIVIRHLNKAAGGNPLYRGGGSIGIIGAARSGLLVGRDPDNPDRRILASTKANLARTPASLTYALEIGPTGGLRVGWIGESSHTAEVLLAARPDEEDRGALQEAVEVLQAILANGARLVNDVKREAKAAGVSERSLFRAKAVMGVKSSKQTFSGKWEWVLPDQR